MYAIRFLGVDAKLVKDPHAVCVELETGRPAFSPDDAYEVLRYLISEGGLAADADEDRARAYASFLDDVEAVARHGSVSFAAALAVDFVELALTNAFSQTARADDGAWALLVRTVDYLLTAHPAAHMLPAGQRLESFVGENADLLDAEQDITALA